MIARSFCLPRAQALAFALVFTTVASLTLAQDICWKDTKGRGVGVVPPASHGCGDLEYDAGLCYKRCYAGYKGVGPVCWQSCPGNFSDTGGHCLKPASYGRGAGFPWEFGDALDDSGMFQRCEQAQGRGGCEKHGAVVYPKCRSGFKPAGCCVCSPICPARTTDIGVSCQKDSYGRGVGVAMTHCPPGQEYDAGLCYDACGPGTYGVGPVCWAKCSAPYPVDCGAACGISSGVCAGAVFKQVASSAQVTLNVALLVSGGGTAVAAGRTAAQAAGKSVMSATARAAAKESLKKQLASNLTKVVAAGTAAGTIDRFAEGLLNAKEEGEFDYSALDPTGVTAMIASFNKPICGATQTAAPPPQTPPAPIVTQITGFSRIQSRWKPDQYLHIESGPPKAGAIQPGWWSAQWSFEPVAGTSHIRIRNRWKADQYMHIERGSLEAGPIQPGWLSAQWSLESVAGTAFVRIRNRWRTDQYLHIERGALEAGTIQPGWLSAQWTLQPVAP